MKIALINENSQAAKNALIEATRARLWSRWAMRLSTMVCTQPMMPPN